MFSYLTRLLIFTLEASITIMTVIPRQRGSYSSTRAAALVSTKAALVGTCGSGAWRTGKDFQELLCPALSGLGSWACWELVLHVGEEMEFLEK